MEMVKSDEYSPQGIDGRQHLLSLDDINSIEEAGIFFQILSFLYMSLSPFSVLVIKKQAK